MAWYLKIHKVAFLTFDCSHLIIFCNFCLHIWLFAYSRISWVKFSYGPSAHCRQIFSPRHRMHSPQSHFPRTMTRKRAWLAYCCAERLVGYFGLRAIYPSKMLGKMKCGNRCKKNQMWREKLQDKSNVDWMKCEKCRLMVCPLCSLGSFWLLGWQ